VARKILVTLGGSDPCNQTTKVLRALLSLDIPDLQAKVVVGSSNPRLDELREAAESAGSSIAISIITDAPDMASLMAWADVAVTGAGSTCWELAFMGLPALLIVLADNQTGIAEGLEEAGTAVNLGWHYELNESDISRQLALLLRDSSRRSDMSEKGRRIVDGQGCHRVSSTLSRQDAPIQITV
ncbi:MAG: UDP-2,4-diacetamido-2,4,6-trideoxy-beta-L-altropyranose hydrolase, partial [Chloroflexi bacterium]|nr:UDP-2,4-diacetamido-2,4,6-trideoxy-beta-L-altropyranose hydrolase [Chloroflexota bacterium]